MSSTPQDLSLRKSDTFYDDADIEVMKNTEVMKVDSTKNAVVTQSGEVFNYNYLVLATGGTPRTLDFAKGISNIFLLRTPEDGNAIATHSQQRNVVIIGASFVGMEVAASLSKIAGSVTIIADCHVPFEGIFGTDIGTYLLELHRKNNIRFLLKRRPTKFITDDKGKLTKMKLSDGTELLCDIVILGIGVYPETKCIQSSEIEMDSKGFVKVDNCMRTNVNNIYAIGDLVSFPLDLPTFEEPRQLNIGHWQLAHAHGKCAARNISSSAEHPLKTVPFFWTVHYKKNLRYAGSAPDGYDDIVYHGNYKVSNGQFIAYYLKNDIVMAIATLGTDPAAADFANLLRENRTLTRKDLETDDWRNKYSLKAKIPERKVKS